MISLLTVKVKTVSGQDQTQVSNECLTLNFIAMGTIKQGILDSISGKVGIVVGSSWKGIVYMRGHTQNVLPRFAFAPTSKILSMMLSSA